MLCKHMRFLLLLMLFCYPMVDLNAAGDFPPDIKRIKDRGVLIVAQYDGEERGFFEFAKGDGQVGATGVAFQGRPMVGFDIELARDIAQELGVALNLNRSAQTYDSVCRVVAAGKADIAISSLSITLERAQYVNSTQPYAELNLGVLVDRLFEARSRPFETAVQLCNRPEARIGLWETTSIVSYAKRLFPRAHLVLLPGLDEMRKALLNGAVDGIMSDEYDLLHMLRSNPSDSIKARFHAVTGLTDELGIAVRPDSPNLLNFLNLFLKRNKIKLDVQQILERGLQGSGEDRSGSKDAG